MKLVILLTVFLDLVFFSVKSQDMMYFQKIGNIAKTATVATDLYNKLDSFKKTRRPNDSNIEMYFDRDVDFGYKHQRINLVLNGTFRYKINLLEKNDTIYLSSIKFDDDFYSDNGSRRLNELRIDTAQIRNYLRLRNKFYKSSKSINNLVDDLTLNKVYAFNCGDGDPKTKDGKHIETLVKNKNMTELRELVQSINCEKQAYGIAGFRMLKKNGVKISESDQKLLKYLEAKKIALVECNGCFIMINKSDDAN
jgi:hypothetical protein